MSYQYYTQLKLHPSYLCFDSLVSCDLTNDIVVNTLPYDYTYCMNPYKTIVLKTDLHAPLKLPNHQPKTLIGISYQAAVGNLRYKEIVEESYKLEVDRAIVSYHYEFLCQVQEGLLKSYRSITISWKVEIQKLEAREILGSYIENRHTELNLRLLKQPESGKIYLLYLGNFRRIRQYKITTVVVHYPRGNLDGELIGNKIESLENTKTNKTNFYLLALNRFIQRNIVLCGGIEEECIPFTLRKRYGPKILLDQTRDENWELFLQAVERTPLIDFHFKRYLKNGLKLGKSKEYLEIVF